MSALERLSNGQIDSDTIRAAMTETTAQFARSLGVALYPEPEVLRADLAQIQAKSLARIIANLINANEPMLQAEADGTVLSVDERGGTGGFVVTVTPAVPARSLDEDLDPR